MGGVPWDGDEPIIPKTYTTAGKTIYAIRTCSTILPSKTKWDQAKILCTLKLDQRQGLLSNTVGRQGAYREAQPTFTCIGALVALDVLKKSSDQ